MKILLAQINTTVGAIDDNMRKAREAMQQARTMGAELCVFPEMTITGYPPLDLLEYDWFIEKNEQALRELAAVTDDSLGAIIGYVARRNTQGSKALMNSAALIGGGRVISRHDKTLLPTYDVFDEGRWFHPAHSVQPAVWRGVRFGVGICEDYWGGAAGVRHPNCDLRPIATLAAQGADLLLSISASPYTLGKRAIRRGIYSGAARRHHLPVAQVNLAGGNDSLVFDGWSNVYNPAGEIVAQAADFKEDLLLFELDTLSGPVHPTAQSDEEEVYHALCLGLRDYVRKCGFKKVVIGLSGGIDSALTAALAVAALGAENVTGVSMPSRYSSDHSKDDARVLAENLGIEYLTIPIEGMFGAFLDGLSPAFAGREPDVTEENIQARCRGIVLMALSNKFGSLVLSTGNKSEMAVGYATLYGDMCGGVSLISDLPKLWVYRLSRWINREREIIPWNTIEKPPSAELRPDQKDSDSLPEYATLDPIITKYVEEFKSVEQIIAEGADDATVRRVIRMINVNEYKRRQAAPNIKITGKAFGHGRRMPIAAKY
ncbi:NAD+ synthase [Candidatus Sumerlaeota bacterium]|nr:NAD+ synthase [Candidatus Sumerlaeota bacterium]